MAKASNQLEGLEILFYSNDHEPAHVHVRKAGEWEMKVYFRLSTVDHLEYDIKWSLKSMGPSRRDIGRLCDYVQEHRESLEREWECNVWQEP